MGLPYLQLSTRFIHVEAPLIAALTGLTQADVIGRGVLLFNYTLEATSTDTTPPHGRFEADGAATVLEAVMGWKGESGALAQAFVTAGTLERLTVGLRVKGCDRYKRTWEKNNRRKGGPAKTGAEVPVTGTTAAGNRQKPALTVPVTGENRRLDGDGDGDGDEKKKPASQERSAPPLELTAQDATPAKKPREKSPGERLYDAMESSREEACADAGVPYTPERWHPSRINKQLGPIAKGTQAEKDDFQAGWGEYLDADENASREPPFSLGFFLASRSTWEARAKRPGPAQDGPGVQP